MGTHIHVHTSDKRRAEIFFTFYFLQKVKLMTVIRTKIEVLKFIEFISEDKAAVIGIVEEKPDKRNWKSSSLLVSLTLASPWPAASRPSLRLSVDLFLLSCHRIVPVE